MPCLHATNKKRKSAYPQDIKRPSRENLVNRKPNPSTSNQEKHSLPWSLRNKYIFVNHPHNTHRVIHRSAMILIDKERKKKQGTTKINTGEMNNGANQSEKQKPGHQAPRQNVPNPGPRTGTRIAKTAGANENTPIVPLAIKPVT